MHVREDLRGENLLRTARTQPAHRVRMHEFLREDLTGHAELARVVEGEPSLFVAEDRYRHLREQAMTEAELPQWARDAGMPSAEYARMAAALQSNVARNTISRDEDDDVLFAIILLPRLRFANHACEPNVTYHLHNGRLVYRALRPIAPGEPITPSYLLAHELLMPSGQRRSLLALRW